MHRAAVPTTPQQPATKRHPEPRQLEAALADVDLAERERQNLARRYLPASVTQRRCRRSSSAWRA
jgi:hypothetical protein